MADAAKQRSYLQIITAEAARLTRLINNVLDFSRMERGEKKYNFQPCDLSGVVRGIEQAFRPHLEAGGFKFTANCRTRRLPFAAMPTRCRKSSSICCPTRKSIPTATRKSPCSWRRESPLPHAEIKVLDRGSGVPRGSGEKIFEKFYRAHDSLASGIQGSGLGLPLRGKSPARTAATWFMSRATAAAVVSFCACHFNHVTRMNTDFSALTDSQSDAEIMRIVSTD